MLLKCLILVALGVGAHLYSTWLIAKDERMSKLKWDEFMAELDELKQK